TRIPFVRAVLPEAKLVYLVRNPLSFINSTDGLWKQLPTWRSIRYRVMSAPLSQWPMNISDLARAVAGKYLFGNTYRPRGLRYPGMANDLKSTTIHEVM